jgi:hypothetical protein
MIVILLAVFLLSVRAMSHGGRIHWTLPVLGFGSLFITTFLFMAMFYEIVVMGIK